MCVRVCVCVHDFGNWKEGEIRRNSMLLTRPRNRVRTVPSRPGQAAHSNNVRRVGWEERRHALAAHSVECSADWVLRAEGTERPVAPAVSRGTKYGSASYAHYFESCIDPLLLRV